MEPTGNEEIKEETQKPKQKAERRSGSSAVPGPVDTVEPEQLIYTGPNIGRGKLRQYAVFRGGIPPHVAALFEEMPDLKRLLVPISELARTQEKITVKGTLEHKAFESLAEGVRN